MPRLVRTPESKRDYDDIWDRIAIDGGNPLNAQRFLRQIDEKLDTYLVMPRAGTPRDGFAPGLRSFPVGAYIVFYRVIDDGIELVRVLHGAQDLARQFSGDEEQEAS